VEKDWTNPGNILTPLLFIRAHAAYRAGCEHAVAGQATEAFPEMRICLENAAYALHIHKNPSLAETWLRRHDNAIALKTVRDEFTVARLRATIAKANRHLATVFGELYDRTIDFGAHPNEKAVTSNLSVKGSGHERVYQQSYLHGDGLLLDNALKTAAQTGVRALEVLQEAFGPRFELLGVRAELLKLRRGL